MHLFADISSHGFGHLAIAAPVLNALAERLPGLQVTLRTQLPKKKLQERLRMPFRHIDAASDFGYVMVNALSIDLAATARCYRQAHLDWERKVETEARFLLDLGAQYVLTNVSYLPLAGAARAGIPAASLCSLNWAELFVHYFGHEPWAQVIHGQMRAAYRSARIFLRTTPAMAMADLDNAVSVGPIASLGRRHDLGLGKDVRAILVAMGGISHRLPVENWPRHPGLRWLVARDWGTRHPDAIAFETFGLGFTDLLCSVDAVLTKPGYGTFTEAACNGVPVLYQRREDWPEQECLIEWLESCGNGLEISGQALENGDPAECLETLWNQPSKPPCQPGGITEAVDYLQAELIEARSRSA